MIPPPLSSRQDEPQMASQQQTMNSRKQAAMAAKGREIRILPCFHFSSSPSWRLLSMGVIRPLGGFLLVLLLALVTRFEPLFTSFENFHLSSILLFLYSSSSTSFFFFPFCSSHVFFFFSSSFLLLFFFSFSSFLFRFLGTEKLDNLKWSKTNKQTNKQNDSFLFLCAQGPDQAVLVAFWHEL